MGVGCRWREAKRLRDGWKRGGKEEEECEGWQVRERDYKEAGGVKDGEMVRRTREVRGDLNVEGKGVRERTRLRYNVVVMVRTLAQRQY